MRRLLLVPALAAAAIALAGCTSGAGSYDQTAGMPEPAVVEDAAVDESGVVLDDGAAFSAGSEGDLASVDRIVIQTGSMTVTVDTPVEAADAAAQIVAEAGGRVDSRSEYAPTDYGNGSAELVIRVPATELDAVLDAIGDLGSADSLNISTSDVTVASQDLDARIAALQGTIERFQALLATAVDIDDLITLESELSYRQAELESLEAQRRYLDDQVAMSTVTVSLRSERDAPAPDPGDFWSGLAQGWESFGAFWAGALVALGVALPWLVLLGLIAFAIVFLVRRRRAKRRVDATPPTAKVDATTRPAE